MTTFRCTSCERRVESPVVIGAGDCPHCRGDVVFDIHAGAAVLPAREAADTKEERPLLRRLLGR